MKRLLLRLLIGFFAALLAASCSGSEEASSPSSEADAPCQAAADEVVASLDTFLEPHSGLTPAEFLGQPELEGLDDFQAEVAAVIARVSEDTRDRCTPRELEMSVDETLDSYGANGLLEQYLVGAVRGGQQVEPRNVSVTPDDDLTQILPWLGDGSTVTLSAGEFTLDGSVLVQSQLTLRGAGSESTVLNSSADTAAIAVLENGALAISDMTINHVGDQPASVIIVFDAPLTLVNATLSGAVAASTGEGGSAVVLSSLAEEDNPQQLAVRIENSVLSNNMTAGVAITASYSPAIVTSTIQDNAQCGVCYFDDAAGSLQNSTLAGNGVGVQVSGQSNPEIIENDFVANEVAGMLIEVDAGPTVQANSFESEAAVGIDVQGSAAPSIVGNELGAHAVALSVRGTSVASVRENVVRGAEIGLLVGGEATPSVVENEITGSTVAGTLHGDMSSGTFDTNHLEPAEGAGVVVEASAEPEYLNGRIVGGLVGMLFRGESNGSITNVELVGQEVGVEAAESAVVTITTATFDGQVSAGAVIGEQADVTFAGATLRNQTDIGVQVGGQATTTIEDSTIGGGSTGVLVLETGDVSVTASELHDQEFGIAMRDQGQATVADNEIRNAATGGVSIESTGIVVVERNEIIDAGLVGIRIGGDATPSLTANTLFAVVAEPAEGEADSTEQEAENGDDADSSDPTASSATGILFSGSAAGEAGLNQIFGFLIGIQVVDDAAPVLLTNRLDGAGIGGVGVLYDGNAAGRAEGNLLIDQQLGFQAGGASSPQLIDNTVANPSAAAVLLQGQSTATLSGNRCDSSAAPVFIAEQANPVLQDMAACPVG